MKGVALTGIDSSHGGPVELIVLNSPIIADGGLKSKSKPGQNIPVAVYGRMVCRWKGKLVGVRGFEPPASTSRT